MMATDKMITNTASFMILQAVSVAGSHPDSSPWSYEDGQPYDGFGPNTGNGGDGSNNSPDGVIASDSAFSEESVSRLWHVKTVHGILASIAFLALFPSGAIAIRLVPGKWSIVAHGVMQALALCVYIAAVGLGAWLASRIVFGDFTIFDKDGFPAHFGIGIALLAAFLFQPFLGILHHRRFKKLGRRTLWSHFHIWIGRLGIPLGMINGSIGLRLGGVPTRYRVAYAIVAVGMWLIWAGFAAAHELRRLFRKRRDHEKSKEPPHVE